MGKNRICVITAAGGNATAIETIEKPLSRDGYASRGEALLKAYEPLGAEQAGFLVLPVRRFEMAGGEFCGNAARAAALLISRNLANPNVEFTMSGFDGRVKGAVAGTGAKTARVEVSFDGLPAVRSEAESADGTKVMVVDLGGIVHVLVGGALPADYADRHGRLTDRLGLRERPAVGVVWYRREADRIRIDPVVWVRAIDSFFYESSCGSGSIAAGVALGASGIVQPTGQEITVRDDRALGVTTLSSQMEMIANEDTVTPGPLD